MKMNGENSTIRVNVGVESSEPAAPAAEPEAVPRNAFTPPIDIHEGVDGLTLEADLPGGSIRRHPKERT
jgi:HSP20 family molecular chaperone IbpA